MAQQHSDAIRAGGPPVCSPRRHVPVVVYAQDSWGEVKLGVVPPDSTVTLRLSDAFVSRGDVDFFVHPKGQPDQETGYLEVRRGERLGILVPPR